jgi:glycolate oxidase FAD binding subunit
VMLKDVDISALELDLGELCETTSLLNSEARLWAVHGVAPRLVCKPSSPEIAAAALSICDKACATVIPWGGGTQQGLGMPPSRADVVLLTGLLNRIKEYEPADLTVTVEAGMRLATLQGELGKNGQWLPVDPPLGEDATIGGLVATNVNGPRRLKNGGLRDLVIGTKVAGVDGTVTKAGGHVVKNVTGYDLNKAHIGGLGTLGILVELSFKIAPKPVLERSWFGVFPTAGAASATMVALLRLPVPPSAVDILNHRAARAAGLSVLPGQWVLLACAAGFQQTVDRYLDEFESSARTAGAISSEAMQDRPTVELWETYRAMAARLRWSAGSLTCRLAVPPAQVGTACGLATSVGPEPLVWAHSWGAVLWSTPTAVYSDEMSLVGDLRRAVEAVDGMLVVENWPQTLVGLDVWGSPSGPLTIMQAIKKQYDPNGTLNPGRYVGGI